MLATSSSTQHPRVGASEAGRWSVSARLVLALAWLLLCALIGGYVVFRASSPEVLRGELGRFAAAWGAAQLAALLLAAALAWPLPWRLKSGGTDTAMTLAAAVAVVGLVSVGLRGIEWARWDGPRVVVIPVDQGEAQLGPAPLSEAGAARRTADPAAGARSFAQSCASCHGPAGQGLPGVAPPVVGVPFVVGSADDALLAMIANGRQPGDPESKMRKLMPARGGNPFLGDGDIANIIDFLRGGGGGSAQDSAPGTPAVPRWVVPPPPAGPPGLVREMVAPAVARPLPAALALQVPTASEQAFLPFAVALSGLHGLLTLAAVGLAVGLMWRAHQGAGSDAVLSLSHLARWCWAGLALTWMVLFPLVYLV